MRSAAARSATSSRAIALLLLTALLEAATSADAQLLGPDDVELADVIEIQLLGRDLYAYDGVGTGRQTIRLELGESVLYQRAVGRLGIVLTDRRALGVTAGSPWREARYRFSETRTDRGVLGERVAIVLTSQRILAYNSLLALWIEVSIGPGENVLDMSVGPGTAVVVTDRRAIGLSPNSGDFVEIDMRLHERIERIRTRSGVATVTTTQRVLVFQGTNARWVVERRKINE